MPLSSFPDWVWHVLEIGGSALGGSWGKVALDKWSGRRREAAETRKTEAEAEKTLGDLVDDRLRLLIGSLEDQIKWARQDIERLEKQVAKQAAHIKEQDDLIAALRIEIDKMESERRAPQG